MKKPTAPHTWLDTWRSGPLQPPREATSLNGWLNESPDAFFTKAARPPQARQRRGGFGDPGTMATNGELPVAPEVTLTSERQISDEFRAIADNLHLKKPWEERVTALLRLEGLVKGGAAQQFPSFAEQLPSLQAALAEQLGDRRSAISRLACHVLSVVAEACGSQAEALAIAMQPALFRAQAMCIQIVTDASDACCRVHMHCCPTPRLLPLLCSTVTTSKNTKLRQAAAEYLLLAVSEWDTAIFERQVDAVEAAIMAAAQDAAAETREAGRAAFVAYHAVRKQAAQAMLRKLPDTERSLRDKLQKAVTPTVGGAAGAEAGIASLSLSSSTSQSSSLSRKSSALQIPSPTEKAKRAAAGGGPMRVSKLTLPSPRGAKETSGFISARAAGDTPRQQRPGFLSARAPSAPGPLPSPSAALPRRPASASASPAATRTNSFSSASGRTENNLLPRSHEKRSASAASRRSPGGAMRMCMVLPKYGEEAEERTGIAGNLQLPAFAGSLMPHHTTPPAAPPPQDNSPAAESLPDVPVGSRTAQRIARPRPAAARVLLPDEGYSGLPMTASRVPRVRNSPPEGSARPVRPWLGPEDEPHLKTLPELMTSLSFPGLPWDEKEENFQAMRASIDGGMASTLAPSEEDLMDAEERFTRVMIHGIHDSHFKVSIAALHALMAALHAPPLAAAFEHCIEALAPPLFAKVADAKEQIRAAAANAVAFLPQALDQEAVLHGMSAALASTRSPKVLCVVMDFFTARVSAAVKVGRDPAQESAATRALVAGCLPLATHKHPDVRHSALTALSAVREAGEASAQVVSDLLRVLPRQVADTINRGLDQVMMEPQPAAAAAAEPPSSPVRPPFQVSISPPSSPRAWDVGASGSSSPYKARSTRGDLTPPHSARRHYATNTPPPGSPSAFLPPTPGSTEKMSGSAVKEAVAQSPMAVDISVDATFSVQCDAVDLRAAHPCSPVGSPQPPPKSERSLRELNYELQDCFAGLRPMPSAAALQVAVGLAPRLPPEQQASLGEAVAGGLVAVLREGTDAELMEVALLVFSDLSRLMCEETMTNIDLLGELLLAGRYEVQSIAAAAEKCTQLLLESLDPLIAFGAVVSQLPNAGERAPFDGRPATVALGALRLLETLISDISEPLLMEVLDVVVPPLCTCYLSANAEIRRLAVKYIVAMHLRVGKEAMLPHLESLSLAQLKLVEIYVDRSMANRNPYN